MTTTINDALLLDESDDLFDPSRPVVIDVDNVILDYNFANQKLNSLKEYFITLTKRQLMFKRFRALKGISLQVQSGDVFGILGTNGSGKSTLLKVVSGILEPTEGSVTIKGNIAPLIEMGAGFDYELTARENVYLNGALLGYSKKFIDEHFEDIISFAEVEDFLDLPLKNYSSGMVSRIAFSIATVIVPDILVVDEVLSVGDQMFQRKCENRIQELIRDHGTTVLIVSHSSEQIERICNKAIWIEKGDMRMIGDAKDVSVAYQMLGGHKGSLEAEKDIFGLLQECPSDAEFKMLHDINGSTYSIINRKLNERLIKADPDIDTVVFVESRDLKLHSLAMSLAAQYKGIVSRLNYSKLDEKDASLLEALKPKRVFLIGVGDFDDELTDAIKAACHVSDVTKICELDLFALSMKVARISHDVSRHSTTAALISGAGGAALAALSTRLYADKTPIIFTDSEHGANPEELCSLLNDGYRDIIYLHDDQDPIKEEALQQLAAKHGATISAFEDQKTAESVYAVIDQALEQGPLIKGLNITLVNTPITAVAAAPLAVREGALTIPIARDDLDSIDYALKIAIDHADTIKRIQFIGPEGSFNKAEVKLFGIAVSKECEEA